MYSLQGPAVGSGQGAQPAYLWHFSANEVFKTGLFLIGLTAIPNRATGRERAPNESAPPR